MTFYFILKGKTNKNKPIVKNIQNRQTLNISLYFTKNDSTLKKYQKMFKLGALNKQSMFFQRIHLQNLKKVFSAFASERTKNTKHLL